MAVLGDQHILLVEDDPDHAEMTIRSLRKNNVRNEIDSVTDGAAALDYLFARGVYSGRSLDSLPAVVLLDLKLPKIDGLEVLKEVRDDYRSKRLPVVILTSSSEESDIVSSYELGANSYIRKPIDFQEFTDAVGKLGLYWMLLNETPPVPEHVT